MRLIPNGEPITRLKNSSIGKSFSLLSSGDRVKVLAVTVIQIFMAILDLAGVAAIGLLGALSVDNLQSKTSEGRISSVMEFLHLSNLNFQTQIQIIGISAVILLVGRTMISIFFTRRVIFFLSRRGASISARLITQLLSQPLSVIKKRTLQETLYAVTDGVGVITLQIIATIVVLASDTTLLLVMFLGLLFVDPITALSTFTVFASIGFILYRLMHVKAQKLGMEGSMLGIKSREKIAEVFETFRESVVRNSKDFYAEEIGKSRLLLANTSAELNFMPYISKYVIETSVILGSLFLAAIQFILQDVSHAVATLAIFLAAGSRIAPAVLRVQQGTVTLRGAIGQAQPTFALIAAIGNTNVPESNTKIVDFEHRGFTARVDVTNVSVNYSEKLELALENVSFTIKEGEFVAIVGPSGSGKTTLVDVILGLIEPSRGHVTISETSPSNAVARWPGAMAYVPQDVTIVSGDFLENVSLGFRITSETEALVRDALSLAKLNELVDELNDGIFTSVGERGNRLSGGQRQRLGIARALFTKPRIIFLDEATSSLDGQTEKEISDSINSLKGDMTIITIAHRLSTIRNADKVIYLENGKIVAVGNFSEVRLAVPDFDNQAKLMGL